MREKGQDTVDSGTSGSPLDLFQKGFSPWCGCHLRSRLALGAFENASPRGSISEVLTPTLPACLHLEWMQNTALRDKNEAVRLFVPSEH